MATVPALMNLLYLQFRVEMPPDERSSSGDRATRNCKPSASEAGGR
jgi:hypothetical protein